MKNLFKKAFTLTELVIVVAIMAILTGISISAYIGITERAKVNADEATLTQLNMALASKETTEGKNSTCYEAVKEISELGLDAKTLEPLSENCEYVWDQETNRFAIINKNNEIVEKDTNSTVSDPTTESYKFWKFKDEADEDFSVYYTGESAPALGSITVCNGFDTGECTDFNIVNYLNTEGSAKSGIILNTRSFATTLMVNGPLDSIDHYGYSGLVYVTDISTNGYVEHGKIGRIELTKGLVKAAKDSTIYQLEAPSSDSYVTIRDNAEVYNILAQLQSVASEASSILTDTITAHACEHNLGSDIVFDNFNVYEVCKKCGYTLLLKDDTLYTQVESDDTNAKNVITPKCSYSAVTEVTSAVNGDVVVNSDDIIEQTSSVIHIPSEHCDHNWFETINSESTCSSSGSKTVTCSLCGGSYTTKTAKKEHVLSYTCNDDGTHTISCSNCDYETTEQCNHTDSTACTYCGYTETFDYLAGGSFINSVCGAIVRVIDVKANHISGATVKLTNNSTNTVYSGTTDSNGVYTLTGASAGTYTMVVTSSDGTYSNTQEIQLRSSCMTTKNVVIETTSISATSSNGGSTETYSMSLYMNAGFGDSSSFTSLPANLYKFNYSIYNEGCITANAKINISYVGGILTIEDIITFTALSGYYHNNPVYMTGDKLNYNTAGASVYLDGVLKVSNWDLSSVAVSDSEKDVFYTVKVVTTMNVSRSVEDSEDYAIDYTASAATSEVDVSHDVMYDTTYSNTTNKSMTAYLGCIFGMKYKDGWGISYDRDTEIVQNVTIPISVSLKSGDMIIALTKQYKYTLTIGSAYTQEATEYGFVCFYLKQKGVSTPISFSW